MNPFTMVEYAGAVHGDDLLRLAIAVSDTREAQGLAHRLSLVAGTEVSVRYVDDLGKRHRFVAAPGDPFPDDRTCGCGILVSM